MSPPRFEVRQASDKQWYYVFIGGNNEPMFTSETFPTKDGAERGVIDARMAVLDEANVTKVTSPN